MRTLIKILLCIAMVGLVPGTASASASQCGPGDLCVWEHDDYQGCFAKLPFQDKDYTDGTPAWFPPCKGHMNDQISSYLNNADRWALFWGVTKYRGLALCGAPGARSPNLKNFGSPETPEDKISSHSLWDEGVEPEFWTDGGHCRNKDYR